MTDDPVVGMVLEQARGLPKEQSRFTQIPNFSDRWDSLEADLETLKTLPGYKGISLEGCSNP